MADDDVQPPPTPRDANAMQRNRVRRRDAPLIEGTAQEVGGDPADPDEAASDVPAEPADRVPAAGEEPVAAFAAAVPPDAPVIPTETAADPDREPASDTVAAARETPVPPTGREPPAGNADRSRAERPVPRRSRMGVLLSVLGVILIALLAGLLYQLGNPPPNPAVAGLTDQVNALGGRLSALEAKTPATPDLNPLETRLGALETKPAAPAPDLKPLEDRVAALESAAAQVQSDVTALRGKLDQLAAAPQPSATPAPQVSAEPADLGPLQKQVADLADGLKAVQGKVEVAPTADLDPLRKQVTDLGDGLKAAEGKIAALPAVDLDPLRKQVTDLADGLTAVDGRVAALPRVDLAPLGGRVDALDGKLAGVAAALAALPRVDLAPVEAKVDALDHRLAPVEAALSAPKAAAQVTEAQQNGSAAETRAPQLAVTGQDILAAIEAGRPFVPAVTALQALGAGDRALAPLRAVAERGAPTRDELLAAFEDGRRAMVGAGSPAPAGSVFDRVVAGAQSLVKVRPAGSAPDTDPDAIVARVGDALGKGEYGRALAAWTGLPEDGKAAGKGFADKLRARVDAEGAARNVVADAIAALGAPK